MTTNIQPYVSGDLGLRTTLNQLIKAVNALNNATGDGLIKVNRTENGITYNINTDILQSRMPKTAGSGRVDVAKLFEVESAATGPGIYNCLPMIIDSDEWDVEQQWDIIDVVQEGEPPEDVTETKQVLNLDEMASVTDIWALNKSYSEGDWTRHTGAVFTGPTTGSAVDGLDYRCIQDHCSGGCVIWLADDWTIGDRCRHEGNAYKLIGDDKTPADTDPPDVDTDWQLDNDEPGVGNAWEDYWDTGPSAALSQGAMIIAFEVTDDDGVTRLVGRQFGQNFLNQFIDVC
jgi:hypothetical protein